MYLIFLDSVFIIKIKDPVSRIISEAERLCFETYCKWINDFKELRSMKKEVLAIRYLKMFKSIALGVILSTAGTSAVFAADRPADADNFYRSDKVEVQKVTFKNQIQDEYCR